MVNTYASHSDGLGFDPQGMSVWIYSQRKFAGWLTFASDEYTEKVPHIHKNLAVTDG